MVCLFFSHVILDEVHERDVMTDIIMVLLKEVINNRPDIKVGFFPKSGLLMLQPFAHLVMYKH